ncbi:MAG: VWA domain-containing protein [Planctomycetes bacterium]|nr:VWA domain-containing protein [Planctomycetota bacterium]
MIRPRSLANLSALLFTLVATLAALWGPPMRPASAADDPVLQTYKKRFTREAFGSDREDVLKALAGAGSAEAREALVWCVARSREFVELAVKDAEKADAKVRPLQDEYDEMLAKYVEQEAKRGNPNPTTTPHWPIIDKLQPARAELTSCEKRVAIERALRDAAYDSHGRCLDRMPAPALGALRAKLADGPLASKDWSVRAEQYELVRSSQAAWVADLLAHAIANDPDPRAIVAAVDGLGGRDPKIVLPALTPRVEDARWVVRAAVLAALERTPCKETVDIVVGRLAVEGGRLRDDCLRILKAMTGADVAARPDAWKQWWSSNREAWTGPPPAATGIPDPDKVPTDVAKNAGKTGGFFGVETNSKRLCFVIDLSGSMNEKAADKGKDTRADMAKAELLRSIGGMEDGSTFALVLFASDVRVWKKEMTVASDESRKAAIAFVTQSPVVGATNTYGALEAAFALGEPLKQKGSDAYADPLLDTIIFLSDGKPTHGRTLVPAEIRAAVREWNKRRRVTVHAIAFGKDADFEFMKGLATDTGGVFVSP